MSSDIWTHCAGSSRVRPIAATAWRSVEAQHLVSTRKLVDSAEEQAILENLIEENKPALPEEPAFRGKHFLLTTSFRYPPLRHGSRFASRWERSLWYGSKSRPTAFAEVAYYRLLFLAGTAAELGTLRVTLSVFHVPLRTARGVDLTREPFAAYRERISSPSRYDESQALGRAMREAGVEAFRYSSARDPDRGVNVGLFTPRPFTVTAPTELETWTCHASRAGVELQRLDFFDRAAIRFDRKVFLVEGSLPAPAP
jgi:hypothetical protein